MTESVLQKETPFFSIIVPTYNTEPAYFSTCIESIIGQSFSDIEIIIIDDGSGDFYAKTYDEIVEADKRIKIVHQGNIGISATRNKGIAMARSKWILFVDSDDWIEPDACERIKRVLDEVDCDILLFDHVKEYQSGVKTRRRTGLENNRSYLMEDVKTREYLYRRAMGTPNQGNETRSTIYYSWDKAFKRDFLLANDLQFPAGLPKSEDKVFILRCFEKMKSLHYIEEALYHYRINEFSVSNRYSPNVDEERTDLCVYLKEIAQRMDAELAALKNDPSYDLINKDYNRFVFGIISEILFSKYYHKDYPFSEGQRNEDVKRLIDSELFKSAIKNCKYSELGTEAKVKKFMLTHGMVSLFCEAKRRKNIRTGQVAQ